MRLAIVNLTAGGLSGGYLKYLRKLIPHLQREPGIQQLDVFLPETASAALHDMTCRIRTWAAGDAQRGFRTLKAAVGGLRPDVVFVPTAGWLDFGDTPVVVMVRNMEPLEVPFDGNPPAEMARNLFRRAMARRACRRATRIIAVSDHVRDFLVRRWSLPAERIAVIPHGVDARSDGPQASVPSTLPGASPGFLFTAGSIRPARGLVDLIDALPAVGGRDVRVAAVIAGHTDPSAVQHRQRLVKRSRRLGVADRVWWAGPLTEAEMRWCYESCSAFVMTSRAEACPNVALEAMSHGCACVSVDRPPMPEFFRSSALYYPPGQARALAETLNTVLSRGVDVESLRAAATRRARDFDWRTTAARTATELQAAANS